MVVKLIVQTFIWYGAMGLVLFTAAGSINWPGASIFLAEMILFSLVGGLWLARHDPALVAERLRPPIQRAQPTADKILLTVLILMIFAALVVMALDAVRFGWSHVPPWVQAIGELILLLSLWIGFWTLRENSFAATVVKLQEERGQTVITTGPYRLVRHPVYALYLLADLGTVALQPSPWNAGVAVVGATCLFLRARLEERVLCRDPRYAEYMQVVRWRFLPGLY